MTFNPLGSFNPNAPIAPVLLAKAKAFGASLPALPEGGYFNRGALHWSVAPMGCEFTDYNGMADYIKNEWLMRITGNIAGNALGDPATESSHTYLENSHNFGISIAGMDGASETNFGPDGVTQAGIETLCGMMAAAAKRYGIDVAGKQANGLPSIATHAEYAVVDDYPTERWDLGSFVPLPAGVSLTPAMRTQCGDALRERIRLIKIALE